MRKIMVWVVGLLVMFFPCGCGCNEKPVSGIKQPETNVNSARVVSVDEVAEHPEKFKGYIGITGKITKVDITNRIFTLGCEDDCLQIPVRYQGQAPESSAEIIAYGEVKKEGNKYLFEATEVKTK